MLAHEVGSGPTLVLIHGFGVDHRIMLPLEQVLGIDEWRRIYLDLPWAVGAQAPEVSSAQEVADLVLNTIEGHLGSQPFAILGNSFGGLIARYVAHELREQVLGLATLTGVVEPDHDRRVLPAKQVVLRNDTILASAGDARDDYDEMAVIHTPESLHSFMSAVRPGLLESNQEIIEAIAGNYALDATPEQAHPEAFVAPTLHLCGRQDHVVGYEDCLRWRDHYPRATYAILDSAGHNAHLERPTVAHALIADWLQRTRRQS